MIAVTGASGHIGANLIRLLLDDGYPVRAIAHASVAAFVGLELERVEADVTDLPSLVSAFEGVDVVYHLAAYISLLSDRGRLERINVTGTRNVIEACRTCGVRRLVHFSSQFALRQRPLTDPLDESRPLVQRAEGSAYDYSKSLAESAVRRAVDEGLDAVILYPTAVLGPNDFNLSHFGEAVVRLASGRLPALVGGGCDWVDARDVASGAIRAAERGRRGEGYILGGRFLTIPEVAEEIAEISGMPPPRWTSPRWLARLYAPVGTRIALLAGSRPLYTASSLAALAGNPRVLHDKAARELGFEPRPFRESMMDALLWYARAGHLVWSPR